MEFLEGSRGIYRPIRVLFETSIYNRALQICWHLPSYKTQMAVMMQLLKLQQENQIPPQVTAEDMINLILEESRCSLREQLWEFELEDFDDEVAKPLLMLVWAVNVSNKMRDVEVEARMLLNTPEALPPNFQHPKVISTAQKYAKILRERQQEERSTKRVCPQEVVMEVVPRVLQGFWVLPPRLLLNMPSQALSKLTVGVTKSTLDRVSNALATVKQEANFSLSIRDDMVLSVLTEIRQTYPHDILDMIENFAPVLLSKIVDVAAERVCSMFQPQSPKEPAPPAAEPPSTTAEEEPPFNPETSSAVVPASFTPPAEPASTDQAREDAPEKPSLEKGPTTTRPPDSAAVPAPVSPPPAPQTLPTETPLITAIQDSDERTQSPPENQTLQFLHQLLWALPLTLWSSFSRKSK